MKVFLDTNILLDYVEEREHFSKYASIIFQLSLMGEIELYAIDILKIVSNIIRHFQGKWIVL